MSIYILGDSHTGIYADALHLKKYFSDVIINYTGPDTQYCPYLMNSIAERGEILLKPYLEKCINSSYIMFVFGEPDVRIHFDKQINELKREEDEVINVLCNKYIKKLIDIVPKNVKIIIRYIIPQRKFSMFGILGSKFIPRGTFTDRVRWKTKMNNKLKKTCLENNIFFLDNYAHVYLTKEDGELKDEYVDTMTHYNLDSIGFINDEINYFW